jgi:hypothetical protein
MLNFHGMRIGSNKVSEKEKRCRQLRVKVGKDSTNIQGEHKQELDPDLPHRLAYLMSPGEQARSSKHFASIDFLADGNSNHSTIF